MSLSSFIAKTGENPKFIAFMAHCFFAAFIVSQFSGKRQYLAAALMLGAAGVKEFIFDRLYEKTPPQTFYDDLTDFIGYAAGVGLALVVSVIGW